jgi:methyl-accepting chemotaxis protein
MEAMSRAARPVRVVGAFGLVVSLLAGVVGWNLISQAERSAGRSVDLSSEALTTLSDTVQTARTVFAGVQDSLATVSTTLGEVTATYRSSDELIRRMTELTGSDLPDSLDEVAAALPGLADVADGVDRALRLAARAPFGIQYDPAVSFGDSVRQLRDTITPIPGQLRSFSGELGTVSASSGGVANGLADLRADLDRVNRDLADAAGLLDRYQATTTDAQDLAADTRGDLRGQARWARMLVVLLGVAFAAGSALPLWLASAPIDAPSSGTPAAIG